jgi:hypothetical protein
MIQPLFPVDHTHTHDTQRVYPATAIANVDAGIAQAEDVRTSVAEFVSSELPQLQAELNPDNGTTARQLLDPLEQVLAFILDARDRTMQVHGQAQDGQDKYGGILTQKTWAVTLVFLLPLILQVGAAVPRSNDHQVPSVGWCGARSIATTTTTFPSS